MLLKTSTIAIEIKKKPIANEILTSEPDIYTLKRSLNNNNPFFFYGVQ